MITSEYGFGPFFDVAAGGVAGSDAGTSFGEAESDFFFCASACIWSVKS